MNKIHELVKTPELDVVRIVSLDGEKVLLVKESDDPNWKLPGGKIHAGETIFMALQREIKEELGVELQENDILNYVSANIPDSENIRHIFLIMQIPLGDINPTDEVAEFGYFELTALPETKFSGHIQSAVAMAKNV